MPPLLRESSPLDGLPHDPWFGHIACAEPPPDVVNEPVPFNTPAGKIDAIKQLIGFVQSSELLAGNRNNKRWLRELGHALILAQIDHELAENSATVSSAVDYRMALAFHADAAHWEPPEQLAA